MPDGLLYDGMAWWRERETGSKAEEEEKWKRKTESGGQAGGVDVMEISYRRPSCIVY